MWEGWNGKGCGKANLCSSITSEEVGQVSNCGIWGAMKKPICLFLCSTCVKLFSYVRAYTLGIGIPKMKGRKLKAFVVQCGREA